MVALLLLFKRKKKQEKKRKPKKDFIQEWQYFKASFFHFSLFSFLPTWHPTSPHKSLFHPPKFLPRVVFAAYLTETLSIPLSVDQFSLSDFLLPWHSPHYSASPWEPQDGSRCNKKLSFLLRKEGMWWKGEGGDSAHSLFVIFYFYYFQMLPLNDFQ